MINENFYELNLLKEADYRMPDGSISKIGKQFETTLEIIEKKLKALEIIVEKGIDVGWFQQRLKEGMTYEQYSFSNPSGKYYLTQEEYEILKEVLL